jgi:iron complex transport system permease protein
MQLTRALAHTAQNEPRAVTWRGLAPMFALAALVTLAVGLGAVCWGTTYISPVTTLRILFDHLPMVSASGYTATQDAIIWDVRAPRVVLAATVGATLAFSGAAYQGVFRNPLAEPYLIGVGAGASVGATLVIVSPAAATYGGVDPLPLAAFGGALITASLAYVIARSGGRVPVTSLILTGSALMSMGTAIVTLLMRRNAEQTNEILNWLLGSFATATWEDSATVIPYAAIALVVILPASRLLNVLQFDDEEARQLGVDVEKVKLVTLGAASLATAAAIAVSGLIGFVGLIVPHAVRLMFGADHRRLLPLSLLFGAMFLMVADGVARTIDPTRETQIGIITALAGAPFFLYLLRRHAGAAFRGR